MVKNIMIGQESLYRFWEKVDKRGINGCWIWTASIKTDGYGQLTVDGRFWRAHRLSWVLHNGPILYGLLVCHHCDTPACVNPAHLFLGTHKDNIRDSINKGRWGDRIGENSSRSILTEKEVLEIRHKYEKGLITNKTKIAREYGVHPGTIHDILIRKNWKHI